MLDKLLIALVPFVPFVAIFMFLAKKARKQKLQEKQQGIIRLQDKEKWEWLDDEEDKPDLLADPGYRNLICNIHHDD